MDLAWNAFAIPGLLAMALALALSGLVYAYGPTRPANRRLAVVLLLEAARVASVWGIAPLLTSPRDVYALFVVNTSANAVLLPLYLYFLATLDSPIAEILRRRPVQFVAFALGFGKAAVMIARPDLFIESVFQTADGHGWAFNFGPYWFHQLAIDGAMLLTALATAASAYGRSEAGTMARRRARAVLAAFGARDLLLLVRWALVYPLAATASAAAWIGWYAVLVPPWETILFASLLSYGILRAQLFDIDLHIKWTLQQSTVAAAFISVFFIVSEGAQQLFADRWGPIIGIGAAGLLILALHPLQHLAERVATTAMPGVKATVDMSGAERLATYREMVEGAWEDGKLSVDERVMLDKLRGKLGLTAEEAARVEREVVSD